MEVWKDHYATLGIAFEATQNELRAQFYALMKDYHPDAGGGLAGEERCKEITSSYEVLSNPSSRYKYDSTYRNDKSVFDERMGASSASTYAAPPRDWDTEPATGQKGQGQANRRSSAREGTGPQTTWEDFCRDDPREPPPREEPREEEPTQEGESACWEDPQEPCSQEAPKRQDPPRHAPNPPPRTDGSATQAPPKPPPSTAEAQASANSFAGPSLLGIIILPARAIVGWFGHGRVRPIDEPGASAARWFLLSFLLVPQITFCLPFIIYAKTHAVDQYFGGAYIFTTILAAPLARFISAFFENRRVRNAVFVVAFYPLSICLITIVLKAFAWAG